MLWLIRAVKLWFGRTPPPPYLENEEGNPMAEQDNNNPQPGNTPPQPPTPLGQVGLSLIHI